MQVPRLPTLVGALLLALSAGRAATYQVGPGRTHATLQAVASQLQAGDLVEVDGGATYSGQITFRNAGTAANPITIRGQRVGGQRPLLATSGGVSGGSVVRFWADHYVFEGFEISGENDSLVGRGVHVVADDVTIRDSLVRDVIGQGIHGSDNAGSLTLDGVEVHHCGAGSFAHQIYVATDNQRFPGAAFRMQFCYLHDGAGGNNVKSRAGRSEIYYNWIEGARYHELDLIGADPVAQDAGTSGLVREDADVVGNVLAKIAGSGGFIARLGSDGTGASHGRYRFVNNTMTIDPAWTGTPTIVRLQEAVQSFEFFNNVVAHTAAVRLIYGLSAVTRSGTGSTGANNWIPRGTISIPDTFTGTTTGAEPGFTDPAARDFTPRATGALFNAGMLPTASPPGLDFPSPLTAPTRHPPTPGTGPQARPADLTIDLGAFEHTVSSRPNTPPDARADVVFTRDFTTVTARVLDNDTDADGDPLALTSVTFSPLADATISGRNVRYTPQRSFSGEDTMTYRVSDGFDVSTATLTVRNPFLAARGTFDGLVSNPNAPRGLVGYFKIALTTGGNFSGAARLNGVLFTVRGTFDFNGDATLTLLRAGAFAFTMTLQLDGSTITGSVTDGTRTGTLSAVHAPAGTAPQNGPYTMLLPEPAARAFPPGNGYALMTVSRSASARIIGKLGDGQSFSAGAYVRGDGSLPVYAALYSPVRGAALGTLAFRETPGVSDCDGTLDWFKPAEPSGIYRDGFATTTHAIAARYSPPPWTGATLTLDAGNLPAPIIHALLIAPGGVATVTNPSADQLALTFTLANGFFQGSFIHPTRGSRTALRGVAYPTMNFGAGVFVGSTASGSADLAVP